MTEWIQWQAPKAVIKTGPHHMVLFGKKSRVAYRYCKGCGVVSLRNEATQKVLRKPCRWEE